MMLDERPGYFDAVKKYQLEEAIIDTRAYLSKRLPLQYPAGGITSWLRHGLEVKLWYGEDDTPPPVGEGAELRAVIEHRGSSRHLDYKLYVYQTVKGIQADFRGILGDFRFRKMQAMLMLAGVPEARVTRVFTGGRTNQEIVEEDLARMPSCRVAVLGGMSTIARSEEWIKSGEVLACNRTGRIVSWEVRNVRASGKSVPVAFLSYPYGDLAKCVGAVLVEKKVRIPIFIGSAGSLSTSLARGDTVCPNEVYDWDLMEPVRFNNIFSESADWDQKRGHCSVQNPLQESGRFVARAVRNEILTADCEVRSFLSGFGVKASGRAGVALFVTDEAWRAEKDISQLSYDREAVTVAARKCFEALHDSLTDIARTEGIAD